MEILDARWFTAIEGIIGIVVSKNGHGDIRSYIGPASGRDEALDAKHIAMTGASFPIEAADELFGR
jgi:uncharacterized membrane protein